MARFSDELIEKIKNEVSLLKLMQSQGFDMKKKGKDYFCCCPFHDDKTPSLSVTPAKNQFNCFGCSAGGTVIDWVKEREGISFTRAVEILQHDLGLLTDHQKATQKSVKYASTKQLPSNLVVEKDEQQALKRVINFYHETLKKSPEALDYLESRGLNHVELINTFNLGFANRTLAYRLPEKNRKAGSEIRGLLQSVGILRKSGHEHFNGCVVVPIFDNGEYTEGRSQHPASCDISTSVCGIYGRKILGNRLRKGTAQHLYLPGGHQGIWNEQSLAISDEIILCESLIDAMTFWVNGFKNVTSSYGTNGFTEELLNALINHEIKRVLIAYDRDEAGNNAADKLSIELKAHSISCYRILFPKNMDANEYAMQMSPASKALGLVIRKAEPMLTAKPRVTSGELRDRSSASMQPRHTVHPEHKKSEQEIPSLAAELSEPTASVEPKVLNEVEAKITEREIKMMFGDRHYRVRGLSKNLTYDQLKVNVMVSQGDLLHVDTLELYNAKQRQTFIKIAASELSCDPKIIKKDLGKVLLKLEALQDEQIEKNNEPKEKSIELGEQEKTEALELLKDKNLLQRILNDFNECGVVGEETNKLVGYLAGVSRKLEKPLAIMIQSTSAAGKSSLMDAVLNLMPEEERVQYSAMTGQSLFYMGETNLKNKILAIAEEEGAENASYALKLLQSEGEITIASTGKNATTGNMETQEYHVEGPVMLFLTSTAIDLDEELLNRCLVLTVNESDEQTKAIHARQRFGETFEGLLAKKKRSSLVDLHRNAQRLLKPMEIVNPYAEQLTFVANKTRTRRDNQKYLSLIRSITLLHQYQRKTINREGIEHIEVTLDDLKVANELAHEVLGRTFDELPPQTRELLKQIHQMVQTECKAQNIDQRDYRFSRKQIRETTGWGNTQLKVHCGRLEEMEYLLAHGGGRGKLIAYQLHYQGEGEQRDQFMMGLIDWKKLAYDDKKSGVSIEKSELDDKKSPPSRGQVGGVSPPGRGSEIKPQPNGHEVNEGLLNDIDENGRISTKKNHHRNAMAGS